MDHRAAPAQPVQPAQPDTGPDTGAACCARHRLAASPASRRALVAGAVGVPLLAACGTSGSSSGDSGGASGSGGSEESSGGSSGSAGTADGIAKSDIPVGGGAIFADQEVVVTQPTEGQFKAFTALCTHQQCLVTEVTDGGIDCSCHGSIFSIEDGSVVEGPAEEPLAEKTVTDEGDTLTIA